MDRVSATARIQAACDAAGVANRRISDPQEPVLARLPSSRRKSITRNRRSRSDGGGRIDDMISYNLSDEKMARLGALQAKAI
jgi:hypothetical protein